MPCTEITLSVLKDTAVTAVRGWIRRNRPLAAFASVLLIIFLGSFLYALAVILLYTVGKLNDKDAMTLATALSALGTICGAIGTVMAVVVALWLASASSRREKERQRRLD